MSTLAASKIQLSKNSGNLWINIIVMLVVACWGGSFVSAKVLLDAGLSAVEVYIYRFTLAYILLLIINHKKLLANNIKDELWFLVCGICGGSVYFIAEIAALNYTLTSNVSLITTTSPLFTILLIGALYKSERPSKGVIVGSVVAFLGVGLVIFNSSFKLKLNPMGDLLALSSALSFAIYSVALRRLNALYSATFITRKSFFYGVLTAIPFLAFEPEICSPKVLLEPAVWANLLFLAAGCSVIAFVVWSIANKRIGAIRANNYLYFQPVWTLVFSALLLHEPIYTIGVIGCSLIIGGVWLSNYLGGKKKV